MKKLIRVIAIAMAAGATLCSCAQGSRMDAAAEILSVRFSQSDYFVTGVGESEIDMPVQVLTVPDGRDYDLRVIGSTAELPDITMTKAGGGDVTVRMNGGQTMEGRDHRIVMIEVSGRCWSEGKERVQKDTCSVHLFI